MRVHVVATLATLATLAGCRDPAAPAVAPLPGSPPALAVDASALALAPAPDAATPPDAAPLSRPDESSRASGPECRVHADCAADQVCCAVYAGKRLGHQCGTPGTTWASHTPYAQRAALSNITTVCPASR